MQDINELKSEKPRQERVISHALVEVRQSLWWPFGVHTAVLLDISPSGFKIEFTGKARCQSEDKLWMKIPLSPFGISAPEAITIKVLVKWFDEKRMRIGGVFESLDNTSKLYLDQIIDRVKENTL